MHHISEIRIRNFKSISSGKFALSHFTPLVGYNNAGKTNILRALAWIIRRSSLPVEDFHQQDQPVSVEVEISGITDDVLAAVGAAHRGRIAPLVVDGKLQIRRTQTAPGQAAAAIKFEVLRYQDGIADWADNPAGIDAAIAALFPEPIYIGAMENATEDVGKFASGTTIGKLLKEIMDPVIQRHSPAVTAALQEIERKLSANAADKDETLVELDGRIQVELSKLFPGVSAKTHIPVPAFADFLKSATIRIFEDGYDAADGRDASSFGHGAQRSIQIALVKCLSEVRRAGAANNGRTTLLLIDEPELYLHPQAVEVVRAALSRLAGEGYQVVITTHSVNMISQYDAPSALLIRRNAAEGTTCYPRIKDVVAEVIEGAAHQSEVLFALSNSSKILFSDRVGIIEGKTERTVLPVIFQHAFGVTPDEDRVGLVDIGGASSIPSAMKVLGAMGVPCKAIVDLDFAFRVASKFGLLDSVRVDVASCKAIMAELSGDGKIGLDAEGLPRSHNGVSAQAAFELFAKHDAAKPFVERVHQILREQGIWMWTRGSIEAHLGIAKTVAAQSFLVQNISDPAFRDSMPDYATVIEALNWLRL